MWFILSIKTGMCVLFERLETVEQALAGAKKIKIKKMDSLLYPLQELEMDIHLQGRHRQNISLEQVR